MYKIRIILLFWILILCPFILKSQNETSSPYSSFGVGILSQQSNAISASMGGVGYSLQEKNNINFKNPASYVAFDSSSFNVDFAFSVFNSTLKTDIAKHQSIRAKFDYLAIGLPITSRWATSIGVIPFSEVGYNIYDSTQTEEVGKVNYRYSGSGGLMQLFWGNGFKITNNFSLGLNLSYLWGNLNSSKFAEFDDLTIYNTKIMQNKLVDGMRFNIGLQYKIPLKNKQELAIGVSYENSLFMPTRENMIITNYRGRYDLISTFDTIQMHIKENSIKGTMRLPQFVGVGLSYKVSTKYLFAADFTWQNWKKFSNDHKELFQDNLITAVGMQYVPNAKSGQYMSKINYRAGVSYSTGYIVVQEHPISSYSFSVGAGFPITTFSSFSLINVKLEYGKMGTTSHGLIDDSYWRLTLNINLNEKWYQRVKLD